MPRRRELPAPEDFFRKMSRYKAGEPLLKIFNDNCLAETARVQVRTIDYELLDALKIFNHKSELGRFISGLFLTEQGPYQLVANVRENPHLSLILSYRQGLISGLRLTLAPQDEITHEPIPEIPIGYLDIGHKFDPLNLPDMRTDIRRLNLSPRADWYIDDNFGMLSEEVRVMRELALQFNASYDAHPYLLQSQKRIMLREAFPRAIRKGAQMFKEKIIGLW